MQGLGDEGIGGGGESTPGKMEERKRNISYTLTVTLCNS